MSRMRIILSNMAAREHSMQSIIQAINQAKRRVNIDFDLHPEQIEVISNVLHKKDCICVLPTGFGKSVIFKLLPFVFDKLYEINSSCVLVVSPLNAIIEDQICNLSSVYQAAVVKRHNDAAKSDLRRAKLIFGHAESFVDDKPFRAVVRDESMQRRVKAIVIDEAHFVVQWKHFRPAYSKLSALGSIFPEIPMLALTATANTSYRKEIKESLAMRNLAVVERNPDRPNLFLRVVQRPNSGDDKITAPLESLVKELKEKREKMPRTIVYGSLDVCGECYSYFECEMGTTQYYPSDAPHTFSNRLFAQYHANYPSKYKDALVQSLVNQTCTARVIFVTVAFGVGIDCRDVERVIHIGVPCTMEDYFQEIGRAGRDGSQGICICYYNSHDISKARRELTPVMKEYATTTSCRRKVILKHFQAVPLKPLSHNCCDNCALLCTCDDCSCSRGLDRAIESLPSKPSSDPAVDNVLTIASEYQLRHDIQDLRLSLSPNVTSLGISLTTGFTLDLIDQVVANFHMLNSVADVELYLPVFNSDHTSMIWKIIQKYKT